MRSLKPTLTALFFLLPALVILGIFRLYPICQTFYLSFFDWDLSGPKFYVGVENYYELMSSDEFWETLYNSVYYVIGTVSIGTAIALGLSLFLAKKRRGVILYRTFYFAPVVSSWVAMSLGFMMIFEPKYGVINYLLIYLGNSNPPGWLRSPVWAMPTLIIFGIWKMLGYYIVFFIAGLNSIPSELSDAASVDGVGLWAGLRYITLPLLSPVILYVLIMSTIYSFKAFTHIYIMTKGGPGTATEILAHLIYDTVFRYFRAGYGATLGVVLLTIVLLLTALQLRYLGKMVFYK